MTEIPMNQPGDKSLLGDSGDSRDRVSGVLHRAMPVSPSDTTEMRKPRVSGSESRGQQCEGRHAKILEVKFAL